MRVFLAVLNFTQVRHFEGRIHVKASVVCVCVIE